MESLWVGRPVPLIVDESMRGGHCGPVGMSRCDSFAGGSFLWIGRCGLSL